MNIGSDSAAGWRAATARCPKTMAHGPCAGVGDDGRCEVPGFGPCTFLAAGLDWPYPTTLTDASRTGRPPTGPPAHDCAARFAATAAARPVVVADLPTAALSAPALRASAEILAGSVDACLLGDHPGARVQFPPSYRARLIAEQGVPAWVGLHCRDRNRVALEGEIAACLDAGSVGVHCVTGDHPALGHRPDGPGVFDLDSIGLVTLAAPAASAAGVRCSVAHAPAAVPTARRLPRLLAKIDAGADTVFVDHCGGPGPVAEAVGALRAATFEGLVLVCVPVVVSAASAAALAAFAADRLPAGYLARVLGGPDGHLRAGPPGAACGPAGEVAAAGIAEATELAERMLEIPGVDGVDLSGATPPGEETAMAVAMAEISRRLLGHAAPGRRRPASGRPPASAATGTAPA